MTNEKRVTDIFAALGGGLAQDAAGLAVVSPCDGAPLARLAQDTPQTVAHKAARAKAAQTQWQSLPRARRAALVEALAAAVKAQREPLAALITLDGGKTQKEALAEADASADILLKTIKDATLPEFNGMLRCKERPAAGAVGLITSFNFPLVVANWTIAPALLAGNAILWKPSEKTPLAALAYKRIFDSIAAEHADLLQLVIGGRDLGAALVADEQVDMVSATGSVAMGQGIKAALTKKRNNAVAPILELGGNNGVIISEKMSPAHLQWATAALLNSFLGTSGQRCTNTRRLIVQRSMYEKTVELLQAHIAAFLASGAIANPLSGASNDYGYGPLIDADAFQRFEKAKARAAAEKGQLLFGKRLLSELPHAYYVEPTLALLAEQAPLMHEETFAPLLFVVPYDGGIAQAMALVNAPNNAGLVNGIYTQSQPEAEVFAAHNQAGHSVINPPKGTGTPAFGMGFGGNKASGVGEILNSADPLQAFTRAGTFRRVAQNKEITMDK